MASEKHYQQLMEILDQSEAGNRTCADCQAKDPEWASINLGVFVCIDCSGVHRTMGTHISKVRSLRLDVWTDELIQFMKENGNLKGNEVWGPSVPVWYPRINDGDSKILREQFIRAKYERKEFQRNSKNTLDISTFPDKPLKTGYIFKKGKESTKWAPRYSVLKTQLTYFKKENDPKELGVIDLKNTKIAFASGKSGKPYSLQLLDGTNDRNYFFCTDTPREIVEWLCAFRLAKALSLGLNLGEIKTAKEFTDRIDTEIYVEGVLAKRTSNRASFQKRWFAADSKTMYTFKDSMAPFPMEKVALGPSKGGWHVQEDEDGSGYQFILKTPYTDGIHAFEAESKNDKAKWVDSLGRLIQRLDA